MHCIILCVEVTNEGNAEDRDKMELEKRKKARGREKKEHI